MAENLPLTTTYRFADRDVAIQEQTEEQKKARIAALGENAGLLTFSAAVLRENYASKFVRDQMYQRGLSLFGGVGEQAAPKEFKHDVNYRFDKDEGNFGYDPYIMSYAESEEEAFAMRLQIDEETAQMQMINDSASGTWGTLFGAFFQPHVAASLAISPVSLGLAIGTEIALEGASEAVLQSQQLTRTFQESAFNVVLTGVGVGILGGAVKYMTRKPYVPSKDVIDDINAGAYDNVMRDGDAAGAMKVGSDITAEEDKLVGSGIKIPFTEKTLVDVFSIGQISNLVNSPSRISRWVGQKMGNNPLFTKAHEKGKTHGVTVEAFTESAMGKTVTATEKAEVMQKTSGLEVDAFEKEVGIAMSNGDRAVNPKVQEAAEMYRAEVVTPIREAAERLGMLESSDALNAKVLEIETQINDIIKSGQAGKGSKKIKDAIAAEKAVIEAKADKTTVNLQKKIDALEKKLVKARTPLKDGKKRTAPASMIKSHHEARSTLAAHKSGMRASTKVHREKLAVMKKQDKAIKAARKEKRELNKKLATGGTSFAESYFPRIYNREMIIQNWDRLENMILEHFQADPNMLKAYGDDRMYEMAQDTMENMMMGRYQNMTVKGEPSPLRSRSLAIMDNVLEDFLEKNASNAMLRYSQAMIPHIMFREVFENRSLRDLFDEIGEEYRVMREGEGVTPEARDDLFKREAADKENLQVMYDRLTNQVQRSVKPQSTIDGVVQASKIANTAAMLGEIVLTSTPDLSRPISHYGLRSFSHGVMTLGRQLIEGIGSQHRVQVQRLGGAIQRTMHTRAAQFADSLEPQGKWAQKVQKGWSKWSGFDMYTDVMESISAHASMDFVLRAAKKVSQKTLLDKETTRQISRMGLDKEDLVAIYKESLATMGADDKVLKYMNTMAWQDVGLAQRVEAGIGSDIKRTIIQSGIGDKPAFMDETTYSWLFQFQTFAMQAQNKILVAGLQNWGKHTAEGLVVMLALGSSVGAIKAWSRGDDPLDWSAEQWLFEGIDRSGLAGAMRYPMNLARWTLATMGVTDDIPSRFIKREGASMFIAPGVAMADNISKSVGAAWDGDVGKSADYAARVMPLNNIFGIRNTLMTLGEEYL